MDANIAGKEDVAAAGRDGVDTTVVDFNTVSFCDILEERFT